VSARRGRSRAAGARALAVATLLAGACADEPPPPPLFEGARPLALASVRENRAPTQPELEELVEAVIEVAGGAKRLDTLSWKRVEDLYLSHTGMLLDHRIRCTTLVRHDRTCKVQLDYAEGFVECRVMLRAEEFLLPRRNPLDEQDGGTLRPQLATGGSQQHVEWDWQVLRLPYLLAEAASLKPLPPRVVEGRTLVGMVVDVPEFNPKFEAWIDPAGPVIAEVRATLPITADLNVRSEAVQTQRFSEWKRVHGVLFPFRRDLLIDGDRFGLGEARSIEVDVELADAEFLPP
jgi:hypothetical protein